MTTQDKALPTDPARDVVVFDGAVELRIDRLTVEPGLVIIHAYAD